MSDYFSGRVSSLGTYGRAAVSGAVGGIVTTTLGPVAGGAAAGGLFSASESIVSGHSATKAAAGVALGVGFGAVGGKVGDVFAGKIASMLNSRSIALKERWGERVAMINGLLKGRTVERFGVNIDPVTGALNKSRKGSWVADQLQKNIFTGRRYNVEAKYRTEIPSNHRNTLSKRQKQAYDSGVMNDLSVTSGRQIGGAFTSGVGTGSGVAGGVFGDSYDSPF